MKEIDDNLYNRLNYLGLIPSKDNACREHHIGKSNYSKHFIQPWTIWIDYPELTSWDTDIIKRVLRIKQDTPREEDYRKIIHDCEERLRQLKLEPSIPLDFKEVY